ncbi:hypothetical protein ACFX13_042005 [Malus domestica]|uniref:Uncharacterized protein n=1 Tax=Malus baccata TaxID=106549 RepID=A0A540KUC3_MALBA|nr:hypothetical protein C1H46_036874 [Malus baccata]
MTRPSPFQHEELLSIIIIIHLLASASSYPLLRPRRSLPMEVESGGGDTIGGGRVGGDHIAATTNKDDDAEDDDEETN